MNNKHFMIGGSRGLLKLALASLLLLPLIAPGKQDSLAVGTRWYVDADAGEEGDGHSWANAFTDLQLALDAALSGDEIWVAEGIYTPTVEHGSTGDRFRSFQLMNGVALYGGFDPSVDDIAFEDRDWVLHETILSGDLNGDDGPDFANNDENSYHVFYHPLGAHLDSSAVLDGFAITGGNANAPPDDYSGGGMFNDQSSSPTLTNCTFYGNWAGNGGGMDNRHNSNPTLTNCTFSNNSAGEVNGDGGGMHNWYSSPALYNCTFSNNSADDFGGGMANIGSSPALYNCTFSNNSAGFSTSTWGGGGMYNAGSSPTLTNCTFYGNSGAYGGGMVNGGSSPTLTNCILWGDTPIEILDIGGGGTPLVTYSNIQGGHDGAGNIAAPPIFVNPGNGDFHLGACSPCIDAGDNSAADLPDYDFEGDPRVLDGDNDGTATVDMGVDEFELPAIIVLIDIKPGGDPNSLMCYNEKEVITVAILTSPEFDATTVDHTTVTFEGASEIHVDKKSGEPTRHEEDVDRDGDTDLVFHFRLGDTNLTCESTEGTLKGETLDAQAIKGTDAVQMIAPGPFESPLRNEVNDVE